MLIGILAYLLIGFVLNLFGILAKSRKQEFKDTDFINFRNSLLGVKLVPKWKLLLYKIIITVISILLFPIFYVIVYKGNYKKKVIEKQHTAKAKDTRLYFHSNISGVGILTCKTCSHSEKITSAVHGYTDEDEPWSLCSYQCQGCGKFHKVSNEMEKAGSVLCECGGELTREKPVFCPQCKTFELSYKMSYIT